LTLIEKRNSPLDSRVRQLRSIASFLLLSLLFVQLGSEWSVAGWLPLYLIHRLGIGPSVALFALSFYFFVLFSGRFLVQKVKPRIGVRTLTICSTILALGGCLMLGFSTSLAGLSVGLAALATGFAPSYSIVKDILDESLHFAPGFYHAILTVAVSGAMCSAWLLGYVHHALGMGALSLFPAAGCLLVLILELLLMFESHLMGERTPARPGVPASDRRTS
jgi:fucose permease